jgi:ABC-type uncharacterized transport system ATPase subunit
MNTVMKFGAPWLLCVCAALMLNVVVPASTARAQEIPVPVQLHVVLLKKVFSLSKTLQGKQLKVVIVFSDASTIVKDEALSGFIAIGIQATACKIPQLAKEADGADVIYIAPGATAAQKFCEERGILSITGMPSLIETGQSSVAIGVESGKPKVFINLSRSKAEKQEFSSDLFKVAKVFQ